MEQEWLAVKHSKYRDIQGLYDYRMKKEKRPLFEGCNNCLYTGEHLIRKCNKNQRERRQTFRKYNGRSTELGIL